MSYPKPIPVDKMRTPMQEYPPAVLALQRFGGHALSASSVITFNDNATNLEITAGREPIAIKWIATTDTTASVISIGATANFDHVIAADQTRKFVIPQERVSIPSIVGANIKEGLYRRVAWNTAGSISSIFATTY
jgi:hypothetical protein